MLSGNAIRSVIRAVQKRDDERRKRATSFLDARAVDEEPAVVRQTKSLLELRCGEKS